MERRFNPTEVRIHKRADGKEVIQGYGAVFYDPKDPGTEYTLWEDPDYGKAVERIMPGAFDKALGRPDDCRGLFNHDPNLVLGRCKAGTMKLSIDAKGLRYEIEPGETMTAKDVLEHLRRGDVTGSSFSFSFADPDTDQRWSSQTGPETGGKTNSVREVLTCQLWDCGPVTFPAYDATTAAVGQRSAAGIDEARESFKRHRQAEGEARRRLEAERVRVDAEIAEREVV